MPTISPANHPPRAIRRKRCFCRSLIRVMTDEADPLKHSRLHRGVRK